MRLSILSASVLLACNDDTSTTDTSTPTDTNGLDLQQVMRDCPTDVGNICPYAGAGYNGVLTGTHELLNQWFSYPMSITWPQDGGEPVAADWNNHRLVRLHTQSPEDGLTVVMGTAFLGDGDPDLLDRTPAGAPGTTVSLNHPTQQVFLSNGILLSDSWHTHKFREWDPVTGMVHVVYGSRPGMTTWDHDANTATPAVPQDFDSPAATALLNQPKELFPDPLDENRIYYVDMRNERIRVWDRTTGLVDTIAGETVDSPVDPDTAIGSKGYCGEGNALQACFAFPKNANPEPGGAIAVTADGKTMFIADSENHIIQKLDIEAGTISLLSGTAPTWEDTDANGATPNVLVAHPGYVDGPAASAQWWYPTDFALDEATDSLYVADSNNHVIRRIDLVTEEVTTVAGTGQPTCEGGEVGATPTTASGTTTSSDPSGPVLIPYLCDEQHHGGDGGPATEATLYRPFGVDIDPDGNLVISDTNNHRFRIVYR